MKFIALYLTFQVIANNAHYKHADKLDSMFDVKYYKTEQVEKIYGPKKVWHYDAPLKQEFYEEMCEIGLVEHGENSSIVTVKQSCESLVRELNGE